MISQIENGDMVSRAYKSGIEFFIRKPINKIEVESVLYKVNERYAMGRYLDEIKLTLGKLEGCSSECRRCRPANAPSRRLSSRF